MQKLFPTDSFLISGRCWEYLLRHPGDNRRSEQVMSPEICAGFITMIAKLTTALYFETVDSIYLTNLSESGAALLESHEPYDCKKFGRHYCRVHLASM